jgi:hypothetical protein
MKEIIVPLSNPAKIGLLTVETKQGSVTVLGTTRNDVLIKYKLIDHEDENHENNKEREGLKKISNNSFDFAVEENNNTISIKSDTWFRGVDLIIEVPKMFNLDINNGMGGDVDVESVSGDLNLSSYLGSVYARKVAGIVNANTFTGEVIIDFNSLTAGKAMSFVSHTGKIDLTFPSNVKASLKMKTEWGDIFSDLDIVTEPSKPELKKDDSGEGFKLLSDSWTYAKVNGGGPEYSIKTQMGSIFLRKK